MTKKVLIDAIADKFDSRAAAERAVDAVTAGVEKIVRSGDPVTLNGFGTFKRADRKARKAHNMHTRELIDIPARRVMTFSSKVKF